MAPGLPGGSWSRGKLSEVWLQEKPFGEIQEAGCQLGPVRTPPTARRPVGAGVPDWAPVSPMSRTEVMTWSPLPKNVLTALRTVNQWIPSEEYHNAADSLLPLTDDPAAKTPLGVDRMSLTTAPGSLSMTLLAPVSSC